MNRWARESSEILSRWMRDLEVVTNFLEDEYEASKPLTVAWAVSK